MCLEKYFELCFYKKKESRIPETPVKFCKDCPDNPFEWINKWDLKRQERLCILSFICLLQYYNLWLKYWGFHEKGTLSYLCALGIDRQYSLNECTRVPFLWYQLYPICIMYLLYVCKCKWTIVNKNMWSYIFFVP